MESLRKLFKNINIEGEVLFDEPLSNHCTFKIGGNAAVFAAPVSLEEMEIILSEVKKAAVPFFILGEGANILFSDNGFDGLIISTTGLGKASIKENVLCAEAGAKISDLAEFSCKSFFAGLEYFFGMPGTTGGSIFMNARCFGQSVSDILNKVFYINKAGEIAEYKIDKNDFNYKVSPFQKNDGIIISAEFVLEEKRETNLLEKMAEFKKEREAKGHYTFPCAGSVFKNNREFGEPTGKIIDSLGLRGFAIGGAMVSPMHANIIVNASGNARAKDVKEIVSVIEEKVYKAYGFALEREIIYVD
ncbi:MAG: UDP-N-acetylmuramate dehydrogenase [Spirochaetes bacterium]|nr:UDP-N-acetylmuramate dehydrogenase [Spirochaetota bacterium]